MNRRKYISGVNYRVTFVTILVTGGSVSRFVLSGKWHLGYFRRQLYDSPMGEGFVRPELSN